MPYGRMKTGEDMFLVWYMTQNYIIPLSDVGLIEEYRKYCQQEFGEYKEGHYSGFIKYLQEKFPDNMIKRNNLF